MKRASVIGGGIAGLASAIRLAAKGYEVHLFEQNSKVGGKMASLECQGFRFDMGPSLFTLPEMVEELFSLAGKNLSDYLKVLPLDTTCRYFFPDGTTLNAYSDKEQFIAEVEKTGDKGDKVRAYLRRQSFLYRHTSDFFLFNSIHKVSNYLGPAGQKSLKALHRLDAFVSMHYRNSKSFTNPNLVQLFDRYATYNGSDPFRAPATLNMIAHLEHNKGAFFPEKGMYSIVQALETLADEMGVVFHTNTHVNRLETKGKKVCAVNTSSGTFETDLVINNTDISTFYSQLLPDRARLNKLVRRERSSSALIFYWGVGRETNLELHNILFSGDYRGEFKALFREKRISDDPTVYIFISKKIVPTDAPAGCENWFVMVNASENVGQNWEEESIRVKAAILKKMEGMLGYDIADQIVYENRLTPFDIERKTSSYHGALYGHSSNSVLSAFLRHPNFSRKYNNLYFVGGSVHPGGGIPLCLASAKIVDQMVKLEKEKVNGHW